MAGPIPTRKIPQLTAYGTELQGTEELEIWAVNTSRRVTARDFMLPDVDPVITAVDFTSVLTKSRYLTQGPGIQMTDNGPGQAFEIAMLGTGALPGDPTALVGLTAINGVALTWMRSDAAPALDQAIAPVWTGQHTFGLLVSGITGGVVLNSDNPGIVFIEADAAAANRVWDMVAAGEQFRGRVKTDDGLTVANWILVDRTGNTVDTINLISTNLQHNGAPIAGGVTGLANPTATIGLAAVNGVAVTAMRSDAAPALSQAIAPTWTGIHTFTRVGAFSTPTVWLSNTRPLMRWTETDASADNGNFYIDVSGETMRIAAIDDAGATSNFFVQFDRTGATLDDILFGCRTSTPRTAFTVAGAAQALDLRAGNDFHLTLQNSITVSFTNPPAAGRGYTFNIFLLQDATGSRTVTWPASVHWSDGITPVLTTTANRLDAVALTTYDGGVTYYGGQILANMVP